MAVGFSNLTMIPSADVPKGGTLVFQYGTGDATQFAQSGEILVITGLQDVLKQAADTFTCVYGASSVTVTYEGATTIPGGTPVTIQLPLSEYALLAPDATLPEVVAKVNTLIELSQARDNVPENEIN